MCLSSASRKFLSLNGNTSVVLFKRAHDFIRNLSDNSHYIFGNLGSVWTAARIV